MKLSECCCLCYCIYAPISACIVITICLTVDNNYYAGPLCCIKEFYVPALDLSSRDKIPYNNNSNKNNTVINPSLFFDLSFHNIEFEHSIRYGDVNITISYDRNGTIASYVVPSFDQEWLETDYRREVVESRGVPWENALKAVLNGSTVVFRVDLAARPKFKRQFGKYSKKKDVRIGADVEVDGTGLNSEDFGVYSKRQYVRIGADVEVDGSGMKVKKNHILLNSADV
ncbi:PREDICTED: uncharacterized protein LOC105972000 [Erythranthe guttata]|uniref:uncharacterized protein LOC105972000 n=1 Tax=Erythranthe guttata TaxID=4155 RepID=UPI00064D7DF8|nr:PREDICTED: uncharacterized protein LOC105972000 [Erythranthe guttata]|eukprot:XP_012852389.1 PREDICTED: uncharacterized protein LOC105972000 [Erythranthe guttata]